ncbi:MAG: hypothetical protein JKY17_09525 [Magnetovibrio sp.]|nr:hypothetical protein [Magnetovibrio sp.]
MAQDLDAQTQKLFEAVERDDLAAAKMAVEAGADLYAFNAKDKAAIDRAIDLGNFYLAQYLLKVRDVMHKNGPSKPVQHQATVAQVPLPTPPVIVKDVSQGFAELTTPPDYPPSKPRAYVKEVQVKPEPAILERPKVVEPKPKPVLVVKPMKVVKAVTSVGPKNSGPLSMFGGPRSMAAPSTIGMPDKKAVMQTGDLQVIPKMLVQKPKPRPPHPIEPKVVKAEVMKPKPVQPPPLPIVTVVPMTKAKLSPIRTFFLKAMSKREPPVASIMKLKLNPKAPKKEQKGERKAHVPWGSVKPAESVMDAPVLAAVPQKVMKPKVPPVDLETKVSSTKCTVKGIKGYVAKNNAENRLSSIVLDLPPLGTRAACAP